MISSHPFGAPLSRRARIRGIALFTLALAASVAAALLLGSPPSSVADSGHAHGAPGTASQPDRGRTVQLSAGASQRIGVTFAEVRRAPMRREIRTVAQVGYDETRMSIVTSKVEGWVERLVANVTGQPVRRGEPLLHLYSPMVVSAQQELLLAVELGTNVGGVSEEVLTGASSLADAVRQRLVLWGVAPDEIEEIERSGKVRKAIALRSPVSGIVVDKPVLSGQRVMAGDPLYRVAELTTVWLEGDVFERDLAAVSVGQEITAEFTALPGEQRVGRIAYVYPTLNPATRTARVRVELRNPDLALKPGMYGTVRFTAHTDPVLTVPRSAVLITGERALAFLKRPDGAFESRLVSVGRTTDDEVEILQGLAQGDTVVASATFLVDAESNLSTMLGGMGDMPGMDIRRPEQPPGGGHQAGRDH